MRKTKLYVLECVNAWGGPWARAAGMGWVEGRMDFLCGSRRKDFKEFCDIQTACTPGIHVDWVGRAWPDFLACGHISLLPYFVSERVVRSLTDENIPFRRAIEIPVTEVECPALRDVPPPKYYILEADAGISVEEVTVEEEAGKLPPGFLKSHPAGGILMRDVIHQYLKYSTWDGSPFFCMRNPDADRQQHTGLFCDHRVNFLALREKWTNFRTVEFDTV